MSCFLGVDGGGSKTRFLLVDASGHVRARHLGGSAYYPETGLDALERLITDGIRATLQAAGVTAEDVTQACIGIPAYGEDRALAARLDAAPATALPHGRYRCVNDMVCGWAGALGGEDGINVVAGTGSIVYGEYRGRSARAGGWGEVFGDEGSAYWIAREGLRLFARMSDGRAPRGTLHERIRAHCGLADDIDLCAVVYGTDAAQRSHFAQLAKVVAAAAADGDAAAQAIFARGAQELLETVDAVRARLEVPPGVVLTVSGTGGMFRLADLVRRPLEAALVAPPPRYRYAAPRFPPEVGAVLLAARAARVGLDDVALSRLAAEAGADTGPEPGA